MTSFDYKCKLCSTVRNLRDKSTAYCCGVDMSRIFLKAPGGVVTPQHKAAGDKLKYYGIKNIITGEGITKNTDLSTPPGITTGESTT